MSDWMDEAEEALFNSNANLNLNLNLNQPPDPNINSNPNSNPQSSYTFTNNLHPDIHDTRIWNHSYSHGNPSHVRGTLFSPPHPYLHLNPQDEYERFHSNTGDGSQYQINPLSTASSSSYLPHYSLSTVTVRSLPPIRSNPRYTQPIQFQSMQQHTYQDGGNPSDEYNLQATSSAGIRTLDPYSLPAPSTQQVISTSSASNYSNTRGAARRGRGRGGRGRIVSDVYGTSYSYRNQGEYGGRGRGSGWRGRGRGRGRNRAGDESNKYASVYSEEPSIASYATTLKSNADDEVENDEEYEMYDDLNVPAAAAAIAEPIPSFPINESTQLPNAAASNRAHMSGENRSIASLPASIRRFFPYSELNRVQTQTFEPLFYGNENIIVSAPTGSGKTVCFEIAILAFFKEIVRDQEAENTMNDRRQEYELLTENEDDREGFSDEEKIDAKAPTKAAVPKRSGFQWKKAVYIAPLKALCEERCSDWQQRFAVPLNMNIIQVTGDQEANYFALAKAHIIITTPEQSDRKLLNSFGLVLVDEIHLLNENVRGATLEGVLTRIKVRRVEVEQARRLPSEVMEPMGSCRILGLSATAPNADEVATWLNGRAFKFDDRHRPVPIEFFVYDYNPAGNPYAFDNALNSKLLEVIRKHSNSKPTIIFNATRKGAVAAAKAIFDGINRLNMLNQFVTNRDQQERLNQESCKLNDHMREFIRVGIGVHHGGMEHRDRQLVERLFSSEDLRVVCATSTLGQGVNFPAFCAIIKGTQHWNGSQMCELDQSTVMQMIGRAGRPQFDTSGVAVILTTSDKLHLYKGILVGRTIESQLKERIIEHLGAECAASTTFTMEQCLTWVRSTFMYTRMHKKPSQYFGRYLSPAQIDEQVDILSRGCVQKLLDAGMIEPEGDQFTSFRALPLVTLMSRWYLQFNTAQSFNNIKPNTTFRGFLRLFAEASEFKGSEFRVKAGDKGALKPFMILRRRRSVAPTQMILNDPQAEDDPASSQQELVNIIPFPTVSRNVNDVADKIQVLVQLKCLGLQETAIGEIQKLGFELKQEINSIMGPGSRVARAIDDFVQTKAERCVQAGGDRAGLESESDMSGIMCGWVALKSAITFRRCIDQGVFENTPHMFTQLKSGIGSANARKLYREFRSFDDLKEWGVERLVASLGKHIQAQSLQEKLDEMPTYAIEMEQTKYDNIAQAARVTIDFQVTTCKKNVYKHYCHLIVGTLRHELLFWRKVKLSELPTTIEVQVDRGTHLKAFILDDTWIGRDVSGVILVRYEELYSGVNPVKIDELKAKLERSFRDLEIAEQEKHNEVEQGLTNTSPEPTVSKIERNSGTNSNFDGVYLSTLTKSTACRHPYPKCLAAECKHRCCYERATNNLTKPLPEKPTFEPLSLLEVAARRYANQLSSENLDSMPESVETTSDAEDRQLGTPLKEEKRGVKRSNEWINPINYEMSIEPSNRTNSTRQLNPFSQALQDQLNQQQTSIITNKRLRLPVPATPLPDFNFNGAPTPATSSFFDQYCSNQTPTPSVNPAYQHLAELFDDDTAAAAKERAHMQEIRRKRYEAMNRSKPNQQPFAQNDPQSEALATSNTEQ